MKRFEYRLETVLDYKTQVLDNLKTEHAAIMQNVNKKQEQIRSLKQELTGYESEFDEVKVAGATIENYRLFDMCIGRMEQIIDEERSAFRCSEGRKMPRSRRSLRRRWIPPAMRN